MLVVVGCWAMTTWRGGKGIVEGADTVPVGRDKICGLAGLRGVNTVLTGADEG